MSKNRGRDWRRANTRRYGQRSQSSNDVQTAGSKSWKLLYFRSNKLHRARQLGRIWPRLEWKKLMLDAEPIRLLFICSRNQWRSPTGEAIYRREEGVEARSAGTNKAARRRVTLNDIRWADLIFVMEEKHSARLRAEFRQEMRHKTLHVLDIPDEYHFMDEELVAIFRDKIEPIISGSEAPTAPGQET